MSFKPDFTARVTCVEGPNGVHPGEARFTNEFCAVWYHRGRHRGTGMPNEPPIFLQVAVDTAIAYGPPGWFGNPPVWDYLRADIFHFSGIGFIPAHPVYVGPMWIGTDDEHFRFDCCPLVDDEPVPTVPFYTGRKDGQTVTFSTKRPFGGATTIISGGVGVLYGDTPSGRGSFSGGNYYTWSHFLDVASNMDIRDGVTRASGLDVLSYSDGDEVRIPATGTPTRYVVVFVSPMLDLSGTAFHRVYLLRDQAAWPLVP